MQFKIRLCNYFGKFPDDWNKLNHWDEYNIIFIIFSIPDEQVKRTAWERAMLNQECGSSSWVCMQHFEQNQFISKSDGTIQLIPGAIPTLFDVLLIEVNEDFDQDNSIDELQAQNMQLNHEIDQLKSKLQSEKLIVMSQIDSLKREKQKQAKEIQFMRKEVSQLKNELEKSTKLVDELKQDCQDQLVIIHKLM